MTIIEFDQHYSADIQIPPDGPNQIQTIILRLAFPLITSPLTPNVQAYNNTISQLALRWWADIGAPKDISLKFDPDTDFHLECTPGGGTFDDDGNLSGDLPMLPGVISLMCFAYQYSHSTVNGQGSESGFNWLVAQRRPMRASDVFRENSGWLKALAGLANTQRGDNLSGTEKLDFADTRHWVLTAAGLALAYGDGDFTDRGQDNEPGLVATISWSKLRPYLNPHGIVPKSDWNATLPSNN